MPTPVSQAWLDAIARPRVADALEAVYALIADQITARGPSCWASGRCCNFAASDHRLYTTGLEAAYCVQRLPKALAATDIDQAESAGGCPFQTANICGVHLIKPSACRTYFCDRSAQAWQHDLTEAAIRQIRALHDREAIQYQYAEWRTLLREFT